MSKKTKSLCPCGSGKPFEDCCGRFIVRGESPQTAEELMRSRYTAFVFNDLNWIRLTWAHEKCPEDVSCSPSIKWIDLTVKSHKRIDETHATVEFVARARDGATGAFRMHAVSRFEKRDGRWFYVDDVPEK